MKIVKCLEESGLLTKVVSETVENEVKEQKRKFLDMLAATLAASLLGSTLTGKGVVRGGDGVIRAGEGIIKAIIKTIIKVKDSIFNVTSSFKLF